MKGLALSAPFLALLLSLGGLGCSADDQEPDPCTDFSCNGHGDCLVLGGQAMCECDEVTYWDGFTCAPKPECVGTGQECSSDLDCCTGFCFWDSHLSQVYCSPHTCQGDVDCIDQSDDPAPMCCVQDSGLTSHCHKLEDGAACGSQTGECGASCDEQGDSACLPGYMCAHTGCHSQCLMPCEQDSDCRGCHDEYDPHSTFTCWNLSGGEQYCIVMTSDDCTSEHNCCDDRVEACIPWTSADGMSMEGVCHKIGDVPIGEACEGDDPIELPPEQQCVGFYCLRDHCTEVCIFDEDCPPDMVCGNWTFQMNQDGSVTAQIGMCLWMAGSRDPCESDLDCSAGEVCDQYQPPNGPWTKVCTTPRCDLAEDGCAGFGEPCGPGIARCASWLCLPDPVTGEGFCSAQCEPNHGCPPNADCVLIAVLGREDSMWACR